MMNIQMNTLRASQYFPRAISCTLMIFCFLNIPSVGMAQDEDVAAIRSAAEQGDASAQYHLGVAYIFGNGVKKDFREAVNGLVRPRNRVT
jgi:TPR repeat protein